MIKKITPTANYNVNISNEMIELTKTLNTLPGIETLCHGDGKSSVPLSVWFKSKNPKGLFILTRSIDKRYWRYGYDWDISLSVGDSFDNNYLPIVYWLHPNILMDEERINRDITSLIDNIECHYDDDNFLNHYDINLEEYKENILLHNRNAKIHKITHG